MRELRKMSSRDSNELTAMAQPLSMRARRDSDEATRASAPLIEDTPQGYAGDEERPFREHELVMFGGGDHLVVRAAEHQEDESPTVELLLLGGLPIGEPIAHYGPFVMNSKAEIIQALEDYEAGRMGTIPAVTLGE